MIWIGFLVLCLGIAWRYVSRFLRSKDVSLNGKHVLITGGSSGIGKAVACEAVKQGANVTLIARNPERLDDAKDEVRSHCLRVSQVVQCISLDVTKPYKDISDAVEQAVEGLGPVDMLVNGAGTAIPRKMEDIAVEDFRRQMELNYLGSVYVTKAVLPQMKSRGSGQIVFISSQAGLVGLYGFTAYSASKFAIRGFAEALAMEVSPFGVTVTVNCPPDTDTPGFAEEQKGKPEETLLICKGSGLFQPEVVARSLIRDALSGKFLSSIGLDGWLLTTISTGMAPSSLADLGMQVMLLGLLRTIGWGMLQYFYYIVRRCKVKRDTTKRLQ